MLVRETAEGDSWRRCARSGRTPLPTVLWPTRNSWRASRVWHSRFESSQRWQARHWLILSCVTSHDWVRPSLSETHRVLNTTTAQCRTLLTLKCFVDRRRYRWQGSQIWHGCARMGEERKGRQPKVMPFAGRGGEFERTSGSKDEDRAVEECLVLRGRTGVGDIENRLDDD